MTPAPDTHDEEVPTVTPHDPWDDLLPTALVGTARRAVPDTPGLPVPETADPPTALLDRAALAALHRAAGRAPRTGADPVGAAPDADAPEAGPEAARHLDEILADRPALLPEWLRLVAEAGLRAPAAHLPALLDRGARDSALRPAVAAAVGARGHWLSRFRSTWHYLGSHGAADRFDARVWEHGDTAERRRVLAALRRTDPAAAHERVAEALRTEPEAQARRSLLEVLSEGLGNDDEEALDTALGDRSAGVRGLALSLLSRLPGSRHADRLREHLRSLIEHGTDRALRVREVEGHPALLRDLALADPGQAREEPPARAERLWTLITHTPLDVWTELVGPAPADVLDRVRSCGRTDVHDALVNAAGFQDSARWCRALLSTLGPDVGAHMARATNDRRVLQLPALVRPLPAAERCAWVRAAVEHTSVPGDCAVLLRMAGRPWTAELSVLAARMLTHPRTDAGYIAVCEAVAEFLPPEYLDHLPSDPPPIGPRHDRYLETRDTVRFRRDMHREL